MELILGGLATWRLSHLLIYEKGFLNIFIIIRYLVGVRYYYTKELTLKETISSFDDIEEAGIAIKNHFAEVFTCIYCMSIWVSFLLILLYAFDSALFNYFTLFLSFSTIAIFVERLKNA